MGQREAGTALVTVVMLVLVASGLILVTMASSSMKVANAENANLEIEAQFIAEAGLQLQINDLRNARDLATLTSPFVGIDSIDAVVPTGQGNYTATYDGVAIIDSIGQVAGECDVYVDITNRGSDESRDVVVTSIGYVPTKLDYQTSLRGSARSEIRSTLRIGLEKSDVFDYAYFINHWGWFYGNTITANGSVRSNGQFDFGGYGATVNGSPRYLGSNGTDLVGYQDDNQDGITDGSDGGVYSGFSVVSAQNINGMAADPANQHEWMPKVSMPNLSNLGLYESLAMAQSGSISVGGSVVANGVVGDDAGEPQNLFLVGTPADPIILNGPVVVRGDVVLSGTVQGQGAIYSGRNVYVPGSVQYLNAPATPRPTSNDQATVEAWRSANQGADALGLFAREHVVVGDYTNSSWQSYVSGWVNHPLNESSEDGGADGIQNTFLGPDGVLGTADDDVLEGDGVWTVDQYTAADASAGLIPPGFSVGDAVPGSGEDIDGDGQQDGRTQMSEFNVGDALTSGADWGGNMPPGTSQFSDIATNNIRRIDASFYTNHTFAALMLNFGGDIEMNGSIVSRNESIIYGANRLYMNHDARLLGSDSGGTFGLQLPLDWAPIEKVNWVIVDSVGAFIP